MLPGSVSGQILGSCESSRSCVSIEFGWIVPGIKNGFLENGYIGSCDVSLLGS